eukprot:COSAG05_NODE_1265_length_5336_cov_4.379607_1_plen_22_part_10
MGRTSKNNKCIMDTTPRGVRGG